jgi:WD40 repeat protein
VHELLYLGEIEYLWHVSDETQLGMLEGYPNTVNSVAFLADSATLTSGSSDGNVRLWFVL